MAIVNPNKTYYQIKNKKLSNLSMLKLYNILKDTDDRNYFMNIFRSFDVNEEASRNVLYYSTYEVSDEDIFLDNISYKIYKTPHLWWVIALINNIQNPFEDLNVGDNIKVLKNEYISQVLKDVETIGSL